MPGNEAASHTPPAATLGSDKRSATAGAADADIWKMLADVSQSFQMSAASIKAAISSLLDNTIIWDRSAQHEFMVSINESIDRAIPLIVAMTLVMKTEGGTLGWVIEPNSLQEILAQVATLLERDGVGVSITLDLPHEGKPVLVDYDYLRIALNMLLEALVGANAAPLGILRISAIEDVTLWRVHFEGDFSAQATEFIAWLGDDAGKRRPFPNRINSEIMLRAFTAIRILNQQKIALVPLAEITKPTSFFLEIPATGN